ncbi:MAG: hypothetical protein J3Q66DRAFT_84118 [Benniella sp.]|nr:MAG: hypothetical protein J3Q66DRAFT_84118 [Benniella sp.]
MKPPMITLYHGPGSAVSREAFRLLKHASINQIFRIDLVQGNNHSPTAEQITAICGYLGKGSPERGARMILVPQAGMANTVEQAIETIKAKPTFLKRPLLVDWVQSRAIIADPPYMVNDFVKGVGLKAGNQ